MHERLGLLPDTEVEFEIEGSAVRIRKAKGASRRSARLITRLRGRATSGLSTDEILKHTRGR